MQIENKNSEGKARGLGIIQEGSEPMFTNEALSGLFQLARQRKNQRKPLGLTSEFGKVLIAEIAKC